MIETKHKSNCTRVFKNYDASCPRCQELIKGATPRDGWQKQYYANKKREETLRGFSYYCEHGSENLNPGGYCNLCGKGRDFS